MKINWDYTFKRVFAFSLMAVPPAMLIYVADMQMKRPPIILVFIVMFIIGFVMIANMD